jgi:hypothetical protein
MIEIVESKSKLLSVRIYRIKIDPVEATLILIMIESISNKNYIQQKYVSKNDICVIKM